MGFETWFKEEEARAFTCCNDCGYRFMNSEVNIKRGWDAGYAEAKRESQWQPIETAPKDGTHIIAECVSKTDWRQPVYYIQAKWEPEDLKFPEGWISMESGDFIEKDLVFTITRWMPLPELKAVGVEG